MMRAYFTSLLLIILLTASLSAQDLNGVWSGQLAFAPGKSLKLVLHITGDSVTMDSPDQHTYGLKCEQKYMSNDSVSISVARIGMNYTGKLYGDSIVGKFTQRGISIPLIFYRGDKRAYRPQTPQPPFPYIMQDVTIETPGAVLSGTLTLPANVTSALPVVVLVSGSGLQNRDEEIFEHKPFAVLSDILARNGIASLRYDDRGIGLSKGQVETATTEDFKEDAGAVVNYLRSMNKFSKIGIIGHSEGGIISYMLGSQPGTLDFLISIAGPSVNGAEINAFQNYRALLNNGVDIQIAKDFSEALLKANRYRLQHSPYDTVTEEIISNFYPQYTDSPLTRKLGETIKATLCLEKINPWMEYFLSCDPSVYLKRLTIPSLIIYGEKDCQVPPSLNEQPARSHAPIATVRTYPDLNHMMQHAKTGNVDEYKEIEETISEEVLSDIVSFIKSLSE